MMEKLETAIHKMLPGDRFEPVESCHALLEMTGGGAIKRIDVGKFIRLSKQTLSIEGEIIPAEPKVLNDFAIMKNIKKHFGNTTLDDPVLKYTIGLVRKVGRLERDLELKGFFHAFEKFKKNDGVLLSDLVGIQKHIKPLNPDDKERSN